jgi:hypothetical protein
MVECKPAAVVQGYFPGPNIDSVDIRSQLEVDSAAVVLGPRSSNAILVALARADATESDRTTRCRICSAMCGRLNSRDRYSRLRPAERVPRRLWS